MYNPLSSQIIYPNLANQKSVLTVALIQQAFEH